MGLGRRLSAKLPSAESGKHSSRSRFGSYAPLFSPKPHLLAPIGTREGHAGALFCPGRSFVLALGGVRPGEFGARVTIANAFAPPYTMGQLKTHDSLLLSSYQERQLELAMSDGTSLTAPVVSVDRYEFTLEGGRLVDKTECVGFFPREKEAFLVSQELPRLPIPRKLRLRVNQKKLRALDLDSIGATLGLVLVNGWKVRGVLEHLNLYLLRLTDGEGRPFHVYRHALVDYEVLAPPEAHPQRKELRALARRLHYQGQRRQRKALRKVRRALSQEAFLALEQEVLRPMVSGKLKLVLKTLPPVVALGPDLYWMPLKNQAKGLPAAVDLEETPLDVLIPKKTWKKGQTRAQELRTSTGLDPIYILEAQIGLRQGRLCAVVQGLQVVSGKPAEPKEAPPKPSMATPEPETKRAFVVSQDGVHPSPNDKVMKKA